MFTLQFLKKSAGEPKSVLESIFPVTNEEVQLENFKRLSKESFRERERVPTEEFQPENYYSRASMDSG